MQQLHLRDAGLDCDSLLEICKGITDSMSLAHLDLKYNIFDKRGLAGLIKSLESNMSIKHLYLESMAIHMPEAKLLSTFLAKDECKIEELELNEADIHIDALDEIMGALYKADHLVKLSLTKNELDETICDHLKFLP